MATATTRDPDAPFALSSLIGTGGVGGNGEKLISSLAHYYPEELTAAQLRRVNQRLTDKLDEKALSSVAKIAGVEKVERAKVRGGENRDEDAVVTYVFHDADGLAWKGCFPYSDLGKASSDGHVSQRDSLAASPAARDHAKAQAVARAEQPQASSGDPIADFEDMKVGDVVAYLEAHPDRADTVKALERATRRDDARKTVLEWEPKASEETPPAPPAP